MQNLIERTRIVGAVHPISQGAGSVNTGVVDMNHFTNVMFIALTGVLGASATVDMKIQVGNVANLSDAADLTGKAVTQLVKASNDNNAVIISINQDEIVGFRYCRALITVGTAASLIGAVAIGELKHYVGANDSYDIAAVVQMVR